MLVISAEVIFVVTISCNVVNVKDVVSVVDHRLESAEIGWDLLLWWNELW